MYSEEKIAQLRLIRTSGIGPKTFFDLLSFHQNAINAINELEKKTLICKKEIILEEIKEATNFGSKYIFWDELEYPKLLLEIQNFPPILNVIGDISFLNDKNVGAISIVGSRSASLVGKKLTEYFSKELALRNFIIISGMASGIDQAAHEAIIQMNFKQEEICKQKESFKPPFKTIAVLGSGLKNPYPSQNFMKKILNGGGAVISEYSFFENPKKENFPMRNRILSGLSHGILVVEADEKSGSMITARFALEQGRLVFSIPGCPIDSRSSGTNKLIKDGAVLTRDINDILDEMTQFSFINNGAKYKLKQKDLFQEKEEEFLDEINHQNEQKSQVSVEEAILKILDYKIPTSSEEILEILKKDYRIEIVFSGIIRVLTMMEIEDLIRRSELGGFIKN